MPRLIDAELLIDDIKNCLWDWETVDGITASTVLRQTITDIKNQPTVDAEIVVRCKDCKFWDYDVIFPDGWCRGRHQGNPSWFCADGERKEDAETESVE